MIKTEIDKWYYENGQLIWEVPCVNGLRHGIEKWYYENGRLWWEVPYVNGVIHGKVVCY